jgi:hypothetical protein
MLSGFSKKEKKGKVIVGMKRHSRIEELGEK